MSTLRNQKWNKSEIIIPSRTSSESYWLQISSILCGFLIRIVAIVGLDSAFFPDYRRANFSRVRVLLGCAPFSEFVDTSALGGAFFMRFILRMQERLGSWLIDLERMTWKARFRFDGPSEVRKIQVK